MNTATLVEKSIYPSVVHPQTQKVKFIERCGAREREKKDLTFPRTDFSVKIQGHFPSFERKAKFKMNIQVD